MNDFQVPIWPTIAYYANIHCVKSVRIQSYSVPYFPAIRLNTERCRVSVRIQSKWRKIQSRRTPNTDTFRAVIVSSVVRDQAQGSWLLRIAKSFNFLVFLISSFIALTEDFFLLLNLYIYRTSLGSVFFFNHVCEKLGITKSQEGHMVSSFLLSTIWSLCFNGIQGNNLRPSYLSLSRFLFFSRERSGKR